MEYQELSRLADSQAWAAKYKATIDVRNIAILADRQAKLDAREGIRVGDFVKDGDRVLRVAHHWGDSVQLTDGVYGGSFCLGDGYVEFSGGLAPKIPVDRFTATDERRDGPVWFFSDDFVTARNGYHTKATFRVWVLS